MSFPEQKENEKATWGVTRQNSLLFARRWSASGTKSKKVAVFIPATVFTTKWGIDME